MLKYILIQFGYKTMTAFYYYICIPFLAKRKKNRIGDKSFWRRLREVFRDSGAGSLVFFSPHHEKGTSLMLCW